MITNTLIVVGDHYSAFGQNENVITVGRLMDWLKVNPQAPKLGVVLGQGIDEQQRKSIIRLLDSLNINIVAGIEEPASLALTHKTAIDNVLISQLQAVGTFEYACQLRLGACSDRLSDHVTGQHIGAMILMEAARQASIAALELLLKKEQIGFLLQQINAQYLTYTFPVPTTLRITIMLKDSQLAKQIPAKLAVSFFQVGVEVAKVEVGGAVCDSNLLRRIESRLAIQVAKRTSQAASNNMERQVNCSDPKISIGKAASVHANHLRSRINSLA